MNNIYDIILNFQNNYYEVYEWKNTDDIINIRKIALFKVNDKDYVSLKESKTKISKETLNIIKKNYLIFDDENIDKITCLITNGKTAMGIIIDQEGYVIKKSSMLYDEEEEVISEAKNIEKIKISFIINQKQTNKSRIEIEKKEILLDFFKNTTDKMILKYIYYDYFLEESNNVKEIKTKLIKETTNTNNLIKLYNIISIFSKYH